MPKPSGHLYGPQTTLAIKNFPISGWTLPEEIVHALACIKKHAAVVNGQLKEIDQSHAKAIASAAQKVQDGKYDQQFPVDVFQTGSGTSSNMNMNEVLATLASTKTRAIHPNDHVNRGQSSNDVFPTAVQVACALKALHELIPALDVLQMTLEHKAIEFREVIKTARTHLMDAVPVSLGDEFDAYAALLEKSIQEIQKSVDSLCTLPLGGTAAGTGLNAHPQFAKRTIAAMAKDTGLALTEATNHIAAQSCPLAFMTCSTALRTTAAALGKIANDIRHMGSGPIAGLAEVTLPSLQPGSSIMPGKVNPVLCESVLQVHAYVTGVDATVHTAVSQNSQFELNTAYPIIAYSLINAMHTLSTVSVQFGKACVSGIKANTDIINDRSMRNPMLVTALNPFIGYDKAAEIAKEAMKTGETIIEVAKRKTDISEVKLQKLLDIKKMI